MKQNLLLICLVFSLFVGNAQCPGCLINASCSDATPGTRLPNVCPSVLPDGTLGVAYSEDITIWLPQTFTYSGIDVTILNVDVLSATSMPAGLGLETSLGPIPVSFAVTSDMRLCAKICGIPTVPGTRTIQLNVSVTVRTPLGVQTQAQSFPIPITINPPLGGNASFSYGTKFACDSTIDSFYGLLENAPYPVSYVWDFGNDGIIDDSVRSPLPINYNVPGEYYVKLTTNFLNYRITRVAVNNIAGASWYWHEFCGDGTGFTLFGIPLYTQTSDADFSMTLTDGTNVYNGSEVSNDDSPTWDFSTPYNPIPGVINLSFTESDGICGSQSGGVSTTSIPGAGVFNFITLGGAGTLTGKITVESYIESSIETIDTIFIYASPATPSIISNVDTFCSNDSVNIYFNTATTGLTIEWFKDSFLDVSLVDSSIWVRGNGTYYGVVTNSSGCRSFTELKRVVQIASPPAIISVIQLADRKLVNTNYPGAGFTLQWYKDGVLLPGENGVMLTTVGDGNYTLEVYNTQFPACKNESAPFAFSSVGLQVMNYTLLAPTIFPNPSNGNFTLKLTSNLLQDIHCSIYDLMGNLADQRWFKQRSGELIEEINLLNFAPGVYVMKIEATNNAYQIKLIIK